MNNAVRAQLESIKKVLEPSENSEDSELWSDSYELWIILTALRGPDLRGHYFDAPHAITHHDIKKATTGVIRYAALGQAPILAGAGANDDSKELAAIRRIPMILNPRGDPGLIHFLDHAKAAFDVLGLKWNEVNVIEKK